MKNNRIHAFSDDVISTFDAVELSQQLTAGQISSKELLEATINRANQVNPKVNAVVVENYTNALESIKEDLTGFFAGIPMYFKDMTTIKGLPTYYGTKAFEGAKPAKINDAITKKILSMGFVNMGTSTMPEFGFTCSTEYPDLNNTTNPWNPAYSVGGSSGGAAALVASGVVPIAHAADGGGSIRIPAACSGLIGLKPSRGRILPSKSLESQMLKIATDGVISRSVRDTAYFYAEAEKYYHNKKLPKIGLVTEPTRKQLTIGYAENASTGEPLDPAIKKVLEDTAALLNELGHTIIPVTFPVTEQQMDDFKLLWASNAFGVKHLGKLLFPAPYNSGKLSNLTNGLAEFYSKRVLKTPMTLRRLKKTYASYQAFLEQHKIDLMLTPTLTHRTPKLGYFDINLDYETLLERMTKWVCFTPYSNANGCPSLSLPMGHDDETDLPIGMLFWANHGNERLLLELAYQIEAAKPWKKIYE